VGLMTWEVLSHSVYAARSTKVGSPLGEECGAFRKPNERL
jgi:hypothetical protein